MLTTMYQSLEKNLRLLIICILVETEADINLGYVSGLIAEYDLMWENQFAILLGTIESDQFRRRKLGPEERKQRPSPHYFWRLMVQCNTLFLSPDRY